MGQDTLVQDAMTTSTNASTSSVNTNVDSVGQQLQPPFQSHLHPNETLNQIDPASTGSVPVQQQQQQQQQYLVLGSSQEASSSSIPTSTAHTDHSRQTANYTTTEPTSVSSTSNPNLSSTTASHRPPQSIDNMYIQSQPISLHHDESQHLLQVSSHSLPIQPPAQFQILHLQLLPLLTQYPQQAQPIYTRPPLPYQSATVGSFAPTSLPTLKPHHQYHPHQLQQPMDVAKYPDMTSFVNSNINSIPIPLVEARFVDHRVCEICGKRITRDMSRHMRTHQSESRFTCEFPKQQCRHKLGKFNRPYDYKKHLLNRHYNFDDPEVKKLHNLSDKLPHWGTCPCGLRFTGEDWLEEHILTSDLTKRCPILDPR